MLSKKRASALRENIGRLLLSLGKIIFAILIFTIVLGREGRAKILGYMPENDLSPSILIGYGIIMVVFIVCGLFLVTKGKQED